MTARPRYIVLEGPIQRVLGSHRTTDVSITEHSHTHHGGTPGGGQHTETHTFVNSAREFAMLLEVNGRTIKLVSDDYIAAVEGDEIRAVCEPTHNGPLVVKDWRNVTRGIRFRTVPQPLLGVLADLIATAIVLFVGLSFLVGAISASGDMFLLLIGLALLIGAAALALRTVRRANAFAEAHAAIDRLA